MGRLDDELDEAVADATRSATGGPDAFVDRLARRIGLQSGAAAVFGQPATQDGVTVIPVAKTRWGFGGGAGSDAEDEGAGGGGGAMTSPVGFIEIRGGQARFVKVEDPVSYWPLVLAGGVGAWLVLRGLRALLR